MRAYQTIFKNSDIVQQTLELEDNIFFDKLILVVATILYTLMLVFGSTQIVVRHIFIPLNIEYHISWSLTAAKVFFVISVVWGAAVCARNNEHIRINFFRDKIFSYSKLLKILLQTFIFIIMLIYSSILFVGFVLKSLQFWGTRLESFLPAIHTGIIDLVVAGGLLLMTFYILIEYITTSIKYPGIQ